MTPCFTAKTAWANEEMEPKGRRLGHSIDAATYPYHQAVAERLLEGLGGHSVCGEIVASSHSAA
jgi:hypothetical protein